MEDRTHYLDYRDIRNDGRIILYKRADHKSPKWTARLKLPNTKGFLVKSTKTSDDFEARRFAEDLYFELEGKARRGESLKSPTFKQLFHQWKASVEIDTKIHSEKYVLGSIRRMEKWPLPFLGNFRLDQINQDVLSDFLKWRIEKSPKPPASSTLRNERTMLNKVFRFAKRRGYIDDLPEIPLSSLRINARPDISASEWKRLYTYLRSYVKTAKDDHRRRDRFYLQQYILILANTGIRVGEARQLSWRDISHTKTLSGDRRLVFTVRGKTGEREVVCNQGVDKYIDRIMTFREKETGKRRKADEYVFCHPDGSTIGSFKIGFQRVLKEAGVLYDSAGKKRVPYSLRHTYATMRITEGVSVFQLAANMGTSVEMIENFYGKKRVREPKMATEITKNRFKRNASNQ